MLISRFEALGLLPDRQYVWGWHIRDHKLRGNRFDLYSFGDIPKQQFQLIHLREKGFVLRMSSFFYIEVSQRKVKRFLKRFCTEPVERRRLKSVINM